MTTNEQVLSQLAALAMAAQALTDQIANLHAQVEAAATPELPGLARGRRAWRERARPQSLRPTGTGRNAGAAGGTGGQLPRPAAPGPSVRGEPKRHAFRVARTTEHGGSGRDARAPGNSAR